MESEVLHETRQLEQIELKQLEENEAIVKAAQEEADKLEKLAKKKASARQGWKKRRQNLEEKEKLAAAEAAVVQDISMVDLLQQNDPDAAEALALSSDPSTSAAALVMASMGASSPAPALASSTSTSTATAGVPSSTTKRKKTAASAASRAEKNRETPPIPGSLQENGIHKPGAENGTAASSSLQHEGDVNGTSVPMTNGVSNGSRKRAASSSSGSTAAKGGGAANGDSKRLRLEDSNHEGEELPSAEGDAHTTNVKIEYSDAMDEAPYTSGANATEGIASASPLPGRLVSSPAPPSIAGGGYADSSRQASPALSVTDSIRSSINPSHQNGKASSVQSKEKEKLTGASLAEAERKVWATIARSNIPKVIKYQQQGLSSRQVFHRRLAGAAAREGKKYNTKHPKAPKDVQIKARRVMRELLLHLKGSEKAARENKRKAEKEQLEKAKKEEEQREAQRQARKLNFLITQTELYSHFVGSKLKSERLLSLFKVMSSS